MHSPVSLLGLATAVPPYVIDQDDVATRAQAAFKPVFARFPQFADIFRNAGIERRYSVRPPDWFYQPLDWSERTKAYLDGAGELYLTVARDALARAGCAARDVDIIVTVSSTGIATPSLDARLAQQIGLRPDVVRVPVFGLGCAGGVAGLALGVAAGACGARQGGARGGG